MAKRKKAALSNHHGSKPAVQIQQFLAQGQAFHQQGQFVQAQACYEQVLKQCPKHFDALYLSGVIAYQTQHYQRALELLGNAVEINPVHAAAYYNLGVVLQKMKEFQLAVECYGQAIAIKPDYAEAYCNRGNVLQVLKQFDAALQSYDQAIALKADDAEVYSNRGMVLKELKQFDAALQSCDKAIALQADYAEAYGNRGTVLHALKQFDAAVECYDQAIALKADFAQAHFNKGMLNLLRGDFISGWPGYEWRWEDKEQGLSRSKREFEKPRWHGHETLQDKTILLYAEQGLGDTLQFCRYVKHVSALGAKVILEAPSSLKALLHNLEGISQLITEGAPLPEFDYHCPLLSLPLALNTQLASIPKSEKYLYANREKVAEWSSRLGAKTKPRIGIAWSGNPIHKDDSNRSIPLSDFAGLLSDNFEFICLQKDIRDSDKAMLQAHSEIRDMSHALTDFSDTAALCELMDIIISVDTSVLHLAAASGRPAWALLSCVPDWRWLLDREDSPWYPTMKLYRQKEAGNWLEVLERVKADLRESFFQKQ